ncbi:MAG: cytochrome P450 [Actinobacteria bacterium]|nr:cytochrome P450 [Actinomycetota bacterium]
MTEISMAASFAVIGGPQRHAAYAELAASGPVHRVTLPHAAEAWLITGYDEVRQALHDPRLVKGATQRALSRGKLSPEVFAAMGQHMLNHDPPDHTRLRRLVTAAFTRRRVEELAPRIQQLTDQLLDALADAEQVDLIAGFAYPLPITVICELLGIPEQRRTEFRVWSCTIVAGAMTDPEEFVVASTAMASYLRELITAKRTDPADDLLSALVAVRDGADNLSENELTSMGFLLLLAGHETTVNLIGNGVHALLTHPEQLALLRTQPDRLPAAVEELLRFDGPVQVASLRQTSEPVEIGGVTIPADHIVLVGLLAANRDPARISDPDVLDVSREDNQHLAFGYGIHHCLGAPLARLEGTIALGTLLARFPRLRLAVPPEQLTWQPGMFLHGLAALPVLTH